MTIHNKCCIKDNEIDNNINYLTFIYIHFKTITATQLHHCSFDILYQMA